MDPALLGLIGTIFTASLTLIGVLVSNNSTRKKLEVRNEAKIEEIQNDNTDTSRSQGGNVSEVKV